MTPAILAACTGSTADNAAKWADALTLACALFTIDTPARVAAFMAQVGHESGGLRYVRELWGPTTAQAGYEGRADLGNSHPGDGRRYLGRGLLQVTGRANYAATREGLRRYVDGVPDFEAQPEALEVPQWAALSAALYWHARGLDALADAGDFDRITRKINGGTNGAQERRDLWIAARKVLGC